MLDPSCLLELLREITTSTPIGLAPVSDDLGS